MAWIPAGLSWWEFGTDQRPRRKAESDYAKRLSLPPEDRAGCTFIFVTPRNWPGKGKWVQEKEASGDGWQAVRAYDASDLEQWLEEAIATPLWFAEQCRGSPVEGIQTLDRYWRDWSEVSDPPISRRIFEPNVKTSQSTFERWLNVPPDRPFVVASDSIGETLAFVTCLFEAAARVPDGGKRTFLASEAGHGSRLRVAGDIPKTRRVVAAIHSHCGQCRS